ncbi:FIST signal transduction protein [Rhodobaculum claviforme]|nr:FIST C-terminal domain-containing protein [Rhodobaculum claviforme]
MQIATGMSSAPCATAAVQEVAAQMGLAARGRPDFTALHFSVAWPAGQVQTAAAAAFGAALHGGSSCLGVMTERGPAIENGRGMGGLAIWDPDGAYGTSMQPLGDSPRDAARRATEAALHAADRPGEAPDLVWLTVAPGHEESVLDGIKDVLGGHAQIVGGSSADNDIAGGWAQFDRAGPHTAAVVVSVLFPSGPVGSAYQSGHAPSTQRGRITRAAGRILHEIDGAPAVDVYARWTGGAVHAPSLGPADILAASTFYPLGREIGDVAGVPFHLLAHPARAQADGSLLLFADVAEGEEIWLMRGAPDQLVARAGGVARESRLELPQRASGGLGHRGALVVYCAGCMLAVRDRMDEVARGVTHALGPTPFLGVFTFGEQGAPLRQGTRHGNLMISCSTFG